MKKIIIALTFCFVLISTHAGVDQQCTIRNTAFKDDEKITFYVFYTVAGIWVNAGTAVFNVNLETLNNKPVYHIDATGQTNPGYDWIYKVRDRYESFIDTTSMQPLKFIRNVNEGSYKKFENVTFNHEAGTAITPKGVFKTPTCVQDVLSEMYLARNMDFNKYKTNDIIPFNLFLDNENYSMHIRYLGKETVKTRYGKFRCIKFKPLLLKGSIFEGGEKMTVWVTDDNNRLPVRIESPISVGSVKVDMMMYSNLRHPLTSLISTR